MLNTKILSARAISLVAGLTLAGCAAQPDKEPAAEEHAGHAHHHMMHAEPDEQGRQLYGMEHSADPALLEELRTNVKPLNNMSNEQIMNMMKMMGSNYTWYASDPDVSGDFGVLILAHGFGDHGDNVLRDQLLVTGEEQPLTFAFGMSMMMSDHIQLGVNDLTDAGVEEIVVVPVVATRHNTLKRQWDYVFGLQDHAEYASVPRVNTDAKLRFAEPVEDHPLAGQIIVDYVAEMSKDPANEEVVIVGHGPVDEGDNQQQLAMMENLAEYVRESGPFAAVHVATLQDDAPPEVRRANVERLRKLVTDAQANGREMLVVTNLLGTRMVQRSLRRDLRGLTYYFNSKGLIEHDNFIEWIQVTIAENVDD